MKKYYMNKRTGEKSESIERAKEWYWQDKDEVEHWYFSEVCGEWICSMEWVHH